MSFNTAKVPQDKSHDALQLFPHHQVHIPSAPGPSSSITSVTVPPAPSDLPIDLGQISPVAPRPSEKDHVLPSSTTDARLQSQLSQIVASNTAPADSPSSVTDSSRQPGAEHSDGDSEVLPSQDPVSAKSKKRKRTRTLTTAPQAAALFALLARTQFPTTTEREEIGRAIGLPARKVQIWFQNQRQKQKKLANSLQSRSQAELATSAPLPLMSQPGFSTSHAERLNAASGLSDNQSLGITGSGTAMHGYGAVKLHPSYAEGASGSPGTVPVSNPYQYPPSSDFASRAHTGHSQAHPQLKLTESTHSPSQYNVFPPTTVPDFSFPFSRGPPGTMAASSFAAQSWLSEDVQQGPDASLPHLPTDATSPHPRPFMPPPGLTAAAPATRSLNSDSPMSGHPPPTPYSSAAQPMHSHDIPPPPPQMASLHLRQPAPWAHRGSLSYTIGLFQHAFPSTPSGHLPSSSLPENPGVHASPLIFLPTRLPHPQITSPYRSQAAGGSRGTEVHSKSPPVNRKRLRPHEARVESKRLRQGTASSLSPPASFSETPNSSNRNHHAMHVPLPMHSSLFQGHTTDPFSEAMPQLDIFDFQSSLSDTSTNDVPQRHT